MPEPIPMAEEDKARVIKHAEQGHRDVHFHFERNKRNKLVCTRAVVPSKP